MVYNNLQVPRPRKRGEKAPAEIKTNVLYGKRRAVLSTLQARLFHALRFSQRIWSAEELMEYVWEGRPKPSARSSLHVLVHDLRQKLPGAVEAVPPHGYRFKRPDAWAGVAGPR